MPVLARASNNLPYRQVADKHVTLILREWTSINDLNLHCNTIQRGTEMQEGNLMDNEVAHRGLRRTRHNDIMLPVFLLKVFFLKRWHHYSYSFLC
jgi:hypothetical protein